MFSLSPASSSNVFRKRRVQRLKAMVADQATFTSDLAVQLATTEGAKEVYGDDDEPYTPEDMGPHERTLRVTDIARVVPLASFQTPHSQGRV